MKFKFLEGRFDMFQYGHVMTILIAIFVFVFVLDQLQARIRAKPSGDISFSNNSSVPSSAVPGAWPVTACNTSGQIRGVSSSLQIVSGTSGFSRRISSIRRDHDKRRGSVLPMKSS